MSKLYEEIARAISANTLSNPFPIVGVIDKSGLVETLAIYFKKTDALFDSEFFTKKCEEIT